MLRDRRGVADEIVVECLEQRRVDRRIAARNEQRVAVGGCPNDRLGADIGAGAWTVLDDKLLAETLREPLADQTRGNVVRAAGRNGNDDTHRPRRVGLRPRNAREHGQRDRARSQMQKISAGKFHGGPNW